MSISGIFQAAEDFAVLGLYNAYDYYNHLRLKHLPRTDLSGLTLAFDIEYDHTLDGAMRLDAAKYPSVSWDSMTFECGVGGAANTYEVRLLDHATVVSGSETPASVVLHITGDENFDGGIDWLTLYFRDTRYTVTSTDVRVETQLTVVRGRRRYEHERRRHDGLLCRLHGVAWSARAPTRNPFTSRAWARRWWAG